MTDYHKAIEKKKQDELNAKLEAERLAAEKKRGKRGVKAKKLDSAATIDNLSPAKRKKSLSKSE